MKRKIGLLLLRSQRLENLSHSDADLKPGPCSAGAFEITRSQHQLASSSSATLKGALATTLLSISRGSAEVLGEKVICNSAKETALPFKMTTTASLLPPFPRIFFLYLEPITMAYGMYMTNIQIPNLQSANAALPLPTMLVGPQAMQNLFAMMLFSLALMLASPPNKRLAQLNIIILAVHDLTHWAGLAWTIAQTDPRGFAAVLDTKGWNPEIWQLAMYPIGTLAIKGATLLGWFGEIRG